MVVFYDLQTHAYEPTPTDSVATLGGRLAIADGYGSSEVVGYVAGQDLVDPVVCHCLNVRASQIERTIEATGAGSLCELACSTGAGTGCTACHRRLRQFFASRRAHQAPPASLLES